MYDVVIEIHSLCFGGVPHSSDVLCPLYVVYHPPPKPFQNLTLGRFEADTKVSSDKSVLYIHCENDVGQAESIRWSTSVSSRGSTRLLASSECI